ncbi:MAG TPA: hypothetical protein VKQ34_04480 [Candidatus Saccharimonadales bacterium]|nr:hypothetical protein [Candidatus Saccharimonadales bacterium]
MNREQLFVKAPAVEQRDPEAFGDTAELGRSPLEDYVVHELPADLRAVDEGSMTRQQLAEKQAGMLTDTWPQISQNLDPHTAKSTHLDFLFMLGGYIPAGADMYRSAPPMLLSLIGAQCDRFRGLRPYMTYEMIVDYNAEEYRRTGAVRVYADGDDGLHERDFYLGHHAAEPYAKAAAYGLHTLAERPDQVNATATLQTVVTNLNEFRRFMGAYTRLPRSTFAYFRQYLAGYADGTRNASGAFMPSVQLLELALLAPTEMYGVYLDESRPYFPDWSVPVIEDWRIASASGMNVEDRVATGSLALDEQGRTALADAINQFLHFRTTHLGITKAQIPDAFTSTAGLDKGSIGRSRVEQQILDPAYKGTAGFDVRNVLTNSVVRLANLRRRLGFESEF